MTANALELVAVLARRGPEDLHALALIARGEQVPDPARLDGLRRAGLIRGGARPRVPAALLVPALALDAALGLRGAQLTSRLVELLSGATHAGARDLLLASLTDQLEDHLDELAGGAQLENLDAALSSLGETLERMGEGQADPAQVTRVAGLCARLVEQLARGIAPRPRRRPRKVAGAAPELLARAAEGMAVALTRPLELAPASALAAALAGPRPQPALSTRQAQFDDSPRLRLGSVRDALGADDPLAALYAHETAQEALARHAAVIALGAPELAAYGLTTGARLRSSVGELQGATDFERVAAHASSPVETQAA